VWPRGGGEDVGGGGGDYIPVLATRVMFYVLQTPLCSVHTGNKIAEFDPYHNINPVLI
jgi:hypothetical protein